MTVAVRVPRRSVRGRLLSGTNLVVVPVSIGAGLILALAVAGGFEQFAGPLIVLLVAATLAEMFPVPIHGVTAGATSFANVFIAASAVLYGWQAAVLVGALTMLLVELYRWQPLVKLVYNTSLYVISGAGAGMVALAIPSDYRTGLVSSAAFYLVNILLLAAVVARSRGAHYPHVARSFLASTFVPFVVMAAVTAILVRLWHDSPLYASLLALPLVAIIAYQRSLMAAVERQRELDQLKDEFISVISHELRTPLTSVYGCATMLERQDVDEPTRRRLIEITRRESDRLRGLVEDALWASRLDAHKVIVHDDVCDVAALAREVTATAAALAPENISFVVDANGGVPPIVTDKEKLQRVLANLVDNAVKYSPDGGTIRVDAHVVDDRLRLTVQDEGIGIPAQQRERIFEKFTRFDPQVTSSGGSGLGLYICRALATELGGEIWVTGNEGRGSTFGLEIPVRHAKGGES